MQTFNQTESIKITLKKALNIPVSTVLEKLSLVTTVQDAVPLGIPLPRGFLC